MEVTPTQGLPLHLRLVPGIVEVYSVGSGARGGPLWGYSNELLHLVMQTLVTPLSPPSKPGNTAGGGKLFPLALQEDLGLPRLEERCPGTPYMSPSGISAWKSIGHKSSTKEKKSSNWGSNQQLRSDGSQFQPSPHKMSFWGWVGVLLSTRSQCACSCKGAAPEFARSCVPPSQGLGMQGLVASQGAVC